MTSVFATQPRRVARLKDVRWGTTLFLAIAHVCAAIGTRYVGRCDSRTLLLALLLWPITAIGVTAGAHRLWSHRSYQATFAMRLLLMMMFSCANQGSIWRWVHEHRIHHRHSDTCADPHDSGRGFFFSHMGWMFLDRDARVVEAGRAINMDDLRRDGCVMFQKRGGPLWNIFWSLLAPAMVANACWNEAFLNALLVSGFMRYVFVLHCTWLVNSLTHTWGERPYNSRIRATEVWCVSFLAMGEGWHNWHHQYPWDYAASEKGILAQYNPTKAFIDLAIACGLAHRPKRKRLAD